MTDTPQTSAPHHHRSARERQRRGPMWGCLKGLLYVFGGGLLVLLVVIGGGWYYVGSASFADLIRLRVEKTLEARLGREVTIHDVRIVRTRPQKVIINDLRVANAPGGKNPYFATVRQIEITGGIESFWGRRIRVGRVDVRDPRIYFEVFPAGAPLAHNFPHWNPPQRGKYEIYQLTLGTLFINGATFNFLDRKHDVAAVADNITSTVKITSAENLYEGTMYSPLMRMRIQDFVPFEVDLRGGFRYTPGVLALQSVALHGRDLETFVSGKLDPLTDGVYDLRLTSRIGLNRIREIFKVNKVLDGTLSLDTRLRGKQGTFTLTGGWVAPKLTADVYDLAALRGKLDVSDKRAVIDVETAKYGGGTISMHYTLPQYNEPYPMSAELRYNGVSLEKLFSDWGVKDTGLRGGATGQLAYHWNKDKVLEGGGEGSARLTKNAAVFSNAKYPLPVGGATDFSLDNGVIRFRRGELVTDHSTIGFTGRLRIEDVDTDLLLNIRSDDFSELDRAAYNLAHSAGKKTFTLLGLGGAGTITGSLKGKIKSPQVTAHIAATGTKYNNVLLGASDIDLHYDGNRSLLRFDKANFREGTGVLGMTGTIGFPDRGPSPAFDLAISATNYPVERAMSVVNLPFQGIHGLASGSVIVTGSPESGRSRFVNLIVTQANDAQLRLNGETRWSPGKGNVAFDLDIAARDFPVADIVAFLDLGSIPVTGNLTGTLHLEGTKDKLEGAGAVTVRRGSLFGEPVDLASAEIEFTKGRLRATNIKVSGPAGEVTGEAEFNLTTQQFSYNIASSSIDLSKIGALKAIAGLFGGKLVLKSMGAGTVDEPELVVEATLNEATLRGLNLPADAPPPSFYLAIRNGRLVIRGAVANALTIEGDGILGKDLAVDGLVRIVVSDVAKLAAMSPNTASLPVAGNLELDLKLSGKLTPLPALRVDGTAPVFDLRVSEHEFTPSRPLRFGLRGGRIVFDDFELKREDSVFGVTGYAELTGDKRLAISVRGALEAALLQLFVHDLRAEGQISVTGDVRGTLDEPQITGSAEMLDAQFKFAGFPQLIDHVSGTLLFKGDRIEIDSLRATIGGGTVIAGGSLGVKGFAPQSARITLQGTDVAIRYFEGLTIEGSFNMLLSGDAERMTLTGDVDVSRALYFKDFDFGTALLNVVLSRRGVQPVVAANWQDRVGLRLHIVAPNTLAVRNNISDVTGSAELDVTGTLANPVVLGLVTLNEGGTIRFQKIDYQVVRGSINFQNPFRIDPYFDITVEGHVSGGGFDELESGPIEVTINLTGTIDRFTPSITSDPPASDITLFSILGFGGLANRTGAGPTGVGTFSQSLIAQSLSLLGSKILPFADTFTIDPGTLDTSNDPGPKVTFEKRVSNNIRVLVVYNLQRAHSRALIEWQINPDWTLQFTRDEVRREFRAEARFRRRYEGHWTWGGNRRPVTMFASLGGLTGGAAADAVVSDVPPPSGDVVPAQGQTIVQIGWRADARFDTSVLTQYVALKTGEPLTIRGVQSSIRNLFATGDFRDIRVDVAPAGDGVGVTFVLSLNYRVDDISFTGIKGADRTRAERELTVHTGDVLSLNAVDRSALAVVQFLNRIGYLEATVDPSTTFERATSRAAVVFEVTLGPRATVGNVVITGNTDPFPAPELIAHMRRKPGKTFRLLDARTDAERMQNFMVNRDHRKATVRFDGFDYDKNAKSVTLRYTATSGPVVRIEVAGVPRHDVRRFIRFRKNQSYSEDFVDTAAEKIIESYQRRGYFNAVVDTEGKLEGNVWTTTFNVAPGEHFRLAGVTFTGNEKVSDDELRKVVSTSPSGGFSALLARLLRRGDGVTRAQLSGDRDAVESYYRLHGFSEATVSTPAVATNPATKTLTVDFPIVEGPQTLVRSVVIEGNEQVPARELPDLQLRRDEPLDPQLFRSDLVALQSFYAERGNAEVQITPRVELSPDKTSAAITYVVAEGPKIKIDDVIVRGNTYTKTRVITRKADLDKGEPFSYTGVLQAQQNLYRLGVFSRVEVQPEQAGTSVADRNIVIQVEEGKDLTVAGSVGATKQSGAPYSPLGSVSIAHRNLLGTGRYLGLQLIASHERREAFLTYREPFIFNYDLPVNLTVFQSEERRPSAHIRQRGTSLEASKIARLQTRWSLRYEYRIGDCLEGDLCDQAALALIPGVDQAISNIKISSLSPTFFWDRRDDPIDPHRGFFTTASVEYAFPLLTANAHFFKEYAQGSYYLPLTDRTVLAVSARVGFIQALGSEPCPDDPAATCRRAVPLTERFTAGGESSHRAFQLDLLGTLCEPFRPGCKATLITLPDGSIAPIGGLGLLVSNIEYRFPIFSSLGGAVFADIGNVFRDPVLDLNDLRYGIGVGARYLSPVGPLRFDIGYKIRREPREKPFAYFVTLGYAF